MLLPTVSKLSSRNRNIRKLLFLTKFIEPEKNLCSKMMNDRVFCKFPLVNTIADPIREMIICWWSTWKSSLISFHIFLLFVDYWSPWMRVILNWNLSGLERQAIQIPVFNWENFYEKPDDPFCGTFVVLYVI